MPTTRKAFWSRPEIAALLQPEDTKIERGPVPSSPREFVSAISSALSRLSGGAQTAAERAREAGRRIQSVLAELDGEIASLSSGADPEEAGRLSAKIAALGAAHPGEAEAKAQMRDLLEKQLSLLRGVDARLEGLKARRARQLDLLRALWQQAQALSSAGADASRLSSATERINALCSEIGDHVEGSTATRDVDPAITESPTIERV
jgi:hypothetical protein